jgi:SAM-dependent methyltransferase
MAFEVAGDAYSRFMGRYSSPLAEEFVGLLGIHPGLQALDVGCGPGALTEKLVARLGDSKVFAVDPSASFVAVIQERFPAVEVRRTAAEDLPFPDATFDLVLAQLVVHFMRDPVAGLTEMARVARPGGVVAASVWDHAGGGSPLAVFWRGVLAVDPTARDESGLAGASPGELALLFERAGMTGATSTALSTSVVHPSFEDWWEPYTLGVGPAGDYVARLEPAGQEALRERCRAMLPAAPFTVDAMAWTVWWTKPAG